MKVCTSGSYKGIVKEWGNFWRLRQFNLTNCSTGIRQWRMVSSGMLRRVALVRTNISEEPSASFIRVIRIGELETTQAATSNRRTLRKNTNRQLSLMKCDFTSGRFWRGCCKLMSKVNVQLVMSQELDSFWTLCNPIEDSDYADEQLYIYHKTSPFCFITTCWIFRKYPSKHIWKLLKKE
jgi:hypothetical protein